MKKHYSNDVLAHIQNAINEGHYTCKNFVSFDEMPKLIKINGVKIQLSDSGTFKDVSRFYDATFDGVDGKFFNNTPAGKYYCKDWKKGNKGIITYSFYNEFNIQVQDVNIVVLAREIDKETYELTPVVENIDKDDVAVPYEEYVDFSKDDKDYLIIKMYIEAYENYAMVSDLEETVFVDKIIDSWGCIRRDITEEGGYIADDSDMSPILVGLEEAYESEELF